MLPLSQRPATRTASTCTPQTARGAHAFKIAGYSLHRGLGAGQSVRSAAFAVGGFDCCIRFYPDGYSSSEDRGDYVAVFLHVLSKQDTKVRASVEFRLVDQATGKSSMVPAAADEQAAPPPMVTEGTEFGTCRFMKRKQLEASVYLREDCLVIECDVLIIKEPRVEETAIAPELKEVVPHSDLSDNLRRFLERKRGTNVTFKVRDELFQAHKIVLAMRSPVFSAEFYGPMAEDTTRQHITIEDMHPDVFRALLHFIYTDAMPAMEDDGNVDEKQETIKHLLVAADRYAVERLKLICEGIHCRNLDAENVATTLVLADKHHCNNLKEACVEFIASSDIISNRGQASIQNRSNRTSYVVSSQGRYMHLKRVFSAVFVDILENVTKSMHGCFQFVGISREDNI